MNDYIKKLTFPPVWLLLLGVIFLADLLFGGRIFLARDWLQDFLPMRMLEAKCLLNGEFPFWNQFLGGGKPFIADPQSQALYPANVLFLLFKPAAALNLYWLLHLYIGGLGAYFFCRQLGVEKQPAGIAAISFMLGTWLVSMLEFSINGATGAWIPWIFGVLARFHSRLPDGAACRPLAECWKQRRLAGALALLFAVQFFANFPEFVIYPCVGYALFIAAVAATGKNFRGAAAMVLFAAIGGLLALLICLPEIAGTRELLPYTERAGSFDARFNMASMSLSHLLSAIFPFIGGFPGFPDKHWESGLFEFWIGAFYSGAIPLMLAPFAFREWARKSSREKIPVIAAVAMILTGCLLAFGENTPVYPWLHAHAPLLGQFRFPTKFLILTVLGMLMLAALGVDALCKKRQAPVPLLVALGVIVAAGGALALCLWANPNWFISLAGNAQARPGAEALAKAGRFALVSWVFLALAFAWVMALAKTRVKIAPLLAGGVLLAFANMWVVSRQLHPAAPAAPALPAPGSLDIARAAAGSDYRAFSVYAGVQQYLYSDPRPEIYGWAWQAGSGGMWAAHDIRQHYSALIKLQKYSQLTGLIYSGNATLQNHGLDLFGVKWIVTGEPWQQILWGNASRELKIIHERPAPLSRFMLFNARTLVATDTEVWQRLTQGRFAHSIPMVEPACLFNGSVTNRPLAAKTPSLALGDKLAVLRKTQNKITLQAETAGDSLLFFGDTWYPGWRATLDGREVPIHRVNYMFMGVEIPPGKHTVEFKFYPRNFTLYLLVALAALGASLSLMIPEKMLRRLKSAGKKTAPQNQAVN